MCIFFLYLEIKKEFLNITSSHILCFILDLTQNPDAYRADTKINGILGGSNSSTGITLEISASDGTPRGIDVTQLFSLMSLSIPPENGFTERTFIKLAKPLDRDVSLFDLFFMILYTCKLLIFNF